MLDSSLGQFVGLLGGQQFFTPFDTLGAGGRQQRDEWLQHVGDPPQLWMRRVWIIRPSMRLSPRLTALVAVTG